LMGCSRFLKERNPAVQVWAVEPPAGEMVDGLRNLDDGYIPPVFDPALLDRKKVVGPQESIIGTRRLIDIGVFSGISSGAALMGALKCAADIDEGVIVTLFPDAGWKYLSSEAWTADLDEVTARAREINYW
jgi:[CysO sulfur-carrier protein]-thiocarboxylate-dependent cysteine synthase